MSIVEDQVGTKNDISFRIAVGLHRCRSLPTLQKTHRLGKESAIAGAMEASHTYLLYT
jgi:hypothetical protein